MSVKVIMNSWCVIAVAIVAVSGCSGVKTPPVGQVGIIGTDGRFSLTAFEPGDGALVGFHKVVIICEEDMPAFDPKLPPPPPKSLIPVRYTDGNTSGLTAEVKSAGKNDFTFALESRPPSR